MSVTATQFRKQVFIMLDKAIQGQPIEIRYKDTLLKVIPIGGQSKLARAKRQNALLVDSDSIVHSDGELVQQIESDLEAGWRQS